MDGRDGSVDLLDNDLLYKFEDFCFRLTSALSDGHKDISREEFQEQHTLVFQEFISDFNIRTLVIQMTSCNQILISHQMSNQTNPTDRDGHASTILIIKNRPMLDPEVPIHVQLLVLNTSQTAQLGTLSSLINAGVSSIFEALVQNDDSLETKTATVNSTRSRINELSMSLQNLQQTMSVPDFRLTAHPVIKDIVTKGANQDNFSKFLSDEQLADSNFLNSLQKNANEWTKLAQSLTRLTRSIDDGSVVDEINFWINIEQCLRLLEEQMHVPEVLITLSVLTSAKRFHAAMTFITDTGVADRLKEVKSYIYFIRDFPVAKLQTANTLSDVGKSIELMSIEFRKLRISSYPVSRSLRFVENVSKILDDKLRDLMPSLVLSSFDVFEDIIIVVTEVLGKWDSTLKDLTLLLRELSRKRSDKILFPKVNSHTDGMKEILALVSTFRANHNELAISLKEVKIDDYDDDISYLYEPMLRVEPLHVPINRWQSAEQVYAQRLNLLENKIVSRLQRKLEICRTAKDMFTIFENYKPVIKRPKIRAGIREYRHALLKAVKDELMKLRQKFNMQQFDIEVARLKDIPPISSSVIWARQMQNEVKSLLIKLEVILESDWATSYEGSTIKLECETLLRKLDESKLIESWMLQISSHESILEEPILKVLKTAGGFIICVNFDISLGLVFKELRHLLWMGYKCGPSIMKTSRIIRSLYPHAIELTELLQTFMAVLTMIEKRKLTRLLQKTEISDAWKALNEALTETWDTIPAYENRDVTTNSFGYSPQPSIQQLKIDISKLFDTFQHLESIETQLSVALEDLSTTVFQSNELADAVLKIQELVDRVELLGCKDTKKFVNYLNWRIEEILFSITVDYLRADKLPEQTHILFFQNDHITLSPALEQTKVIWIKHVQGLVSTAMNQKKVHSQSSLFSTADEKRESFCALKTRLQKPLNEAYKTNEIIFQSSKVLYQKWTYLSSLWQLSEQALSNSIGNSLEKCLQIYFDFLEAENGFETLRKNSFVHDKMHFNVEQVQGLILAKYSEWNSWIQVKLLDIYMCCTSDFHNRLTRSRIFLECNKVDISSLKGVSELATFIGNLNESWKENECLMALLDKARKIFQKVRMNLPPTFVHYEQLESDLNSLKEIALARKLSIDDNKQALSSRLDAEVSRLESSADSLQRDWSKEKLATATMEPSYAIARFKFYEDSINSLSSVSTIIKHLAKALSIPIKPKDSLAITLEEVKKYESVWISVEKLWTTMNSLLSISWSNVLVSDLELTVKSMLIDTDKHALELFQYSIFRSILDSMKSISACVKMLHELKDPTIMPRHWTILFSNADDCEVSNEAIDNGEFTLKDVLALNLLLNEQQIRTVVCQAKGEALIEKSICSIRDHWKYTKFEMFEHKSGLNLILGWSNLFQTCHEDSDALESMKNSPYFKIFEQDAVEWEFKMSKLNEILTCWIETQKLWIYMYEVLGDNPNIKQVLKAEAFKFGRITSDFRALLGRMYQSKVVLDILHISDCLMSLKRVAESLNHISRALTDYLESQRKLFPRFYFVGNSDLLQIVGAGTNLQQLSNQLEKMFTGVSRVNFKNNTILGVYSPEGELLSLEEPIQLTSSTLLHVWMSQLDMQIKLTLLGLIEQSIREYEPLQKDNFTKMLKKYNFQVLLLTLQIFWTELVDRCLISFEFDIADSRIEGVLDYLSSILDEQKLPYERRKIENLIVEGTHMRSVVQSLKFSPDNQNAECIWEKTQKFYYNANEEDILKRITIKVAGFSFVHGLEYIGVPERIIYTPLMEGCCAALAHALSQKLGGSPFGPAGTGKTETIKALGQNFGRMVMVFNCDDSFDFQSMGRLLFGIAQVGAWSCFDEFNRLEENILSAVSTQIEVIQTALLHKQPDIEMLGKKAALDENTGLFITMNRGYDGRSELPDNLKKKFREFNMRKPDNVIIAEVIMCTLGIEDRYNLASKVVKLFEELSNQSSEQKHYDFGLRALKGVLRNCQNLLKDEQPPYNNEKVLVRSLEHMVVPKLTKDDETLFHDLLHKKFAIMPNEETEEVWSGYIASFCSNNNLKCTESFLKKCIQFYYVQRTQQAIILVGETGTGKSCAWQTTLSCMKIQDGIENVVFVIDSKILTKEQLYGTLDPITFDWTDGLFTGILRKINANAIGTYDHSRLWIVFDSDLDPNYAETLNSVLDDNKLLTLPNGERLKIPSNLHLLFEVQDLKYATPATISRCGMIYFSEMSCSYEELLHCYLTNELSKIKLQNTISSQLLNDFEHKIFDILTNSSLSLLIVEGMKLPHFIDFDINRAIQTFVSLICCPLRRHYKTLQNMAISELGLYLEKKVYLTLVWSLAGNCKLEDKIKFGEVILKALSKKQFPGFAELPMIDHNVTPENQEWETISSAVPSVFLESHEILLPDIVIPTIDTIRHESLFFDLLSSRQPFILCGPPGSGKTMTLYNALKISDKFEIVGLTFSKEMSVKSFMKTLKQHSTCSLTSQGLVMRPKSLIKELVIFCDEINLPEMDKYQTQPLILLLRQLIEKKGFWDTSKNNWIRMEGIHIVGACNPPDGVSRSAMAKRFTRHTTVIMVDYPGKSSLIHIYETFFRALLKLTPTLTGYYREFASASIEVYLTCKGTFTKRSHYIYSPRELTRWVKGMYNVLIDAPQMTLAQLIECWMYEGSRLFSDRLVENSEKREFCQIANSAVSKHFPNQLLDNSEISNLLFSNWLSLEYRPVERKALTVFIRERLKIFAEEVLDTELILYDDMIDHMIRIDRVLKQVQGHCILVGPSRSGKSTLTRFVSWMNGLQVIQLNIHRNFRIENFDYFLRELLLKCAIENQKICLLIDESNILDAAFLERMNTLLANSDVPGLFESDDYDNLITQISRKVQQLGLLLDTEQEIYAWFTQEVSRNLHVVFTINDPEDKSSMNVLKSPALYNRCVFNWMGQWSNESLIFVASKMVEWMPFDKPEYVPPDSPLKTILSENIKVFSQAVIDVFVLLYKQYHELMNESSPGIFIDTLTTFQGLFSDHASQLEQKQRFTGAGLDNLKETVLKVKRLSEVLAKKQEELKTKESEARNMLDTMLSDQNEAERKQEASLEIQKILSAQEKQINERRAVLIKDLASLEPEMLTAQRGVKDIKKQQLTEIRSMSNPPNTVKVTLEAVCIILGYEVAGWKDIQQCIRKDDFITSIVNYNTEEMMTRETKQHIEEEYIARPNFNFEVVDHASKACGPLYRWIIAQIKFSSMLVKVGPLKEEVSAIEKEILHTRARLLAADDMIADYKLMIEKSKNEYSTTIRDIEMIKTELASVEFKVNRSRNLLTSLNSEKERWLRSTKGFVAERRNLVGNAILASLYATFCGIHDQKTRSMLLKQWTLQLKDHRIDYDRNFTFCGNMINSLERTRWISLGLPEEDLYIENFYMLLHGFHYPLIIDPRSKMIDFLQNYFSQNLQITSFLDEGFTKKVQNALRFGGCLLIQDAEFFDPILSKVVAKEFKVAGGRRTVQVGDQEVDVSDDFFLIIHTKDPNYQIPPYLKARTTVVNFSINKNSIELQALEISLSREEPEVQNRRNDLIRLNGEYKMHLHQLHQQLLELLNSTDADILENDDLVTTLEQLKLQSAETERRIQDTSGVIEEVEKIVREYSILGEHAVILYSVLEQLSSMHWLYEVTVIQFMQCFKLIFDIKSNPLAKVGRSDHLLLILYQQTYAMFSPNFANDEKIVFGILLFAAYYASKESHSFHEVFKKLVTLVRDRSDIVSGITEMPDFENIEDLTLKHEPLTNFIQGLSTGNHLQGLASLSNFLEGRDPYSLEEYATMSDSMHVILASENGTDGTYRIHSLASHLSKKLTSIALGSTESTSMAEKELSLCSQNGGWVLLQNLQMSMYWIKSVLTNRLEALMTDANTSEHFKVFMTCNLRGTPLPLPLLQTGYKIVHEGERSVIRTALDMWQVVSRRGEQWPTVKIHCTFLLAWFHALLVERCRFRPVGMRENYDFNDADFSAALGYLDTLYSHVANGRDEIDPAKIPWRIVQYNIGSIIYGGKTSNEQDLAECEALAGRLFREEAFRGTFEIVPGVVIPQNISTWDSLNKWLLECPSPASSAEWLGLPQTVEEEQQLLQAQRIADVVIHILDEL